MKSIKKVGVVENILNRFGYYKPEVKKTRKPRAKSVKIDDCDASREADQDAIAMNP